MKNIIVSAVASIAMVMSMGSGAMAVKPSGGGTKTPTKLGLDVSYPQCGKTLPTDFAFAIVGVNNGLANNTSPCFAEQFAWAQKASGVTAQPKASVYVNTANPGLAASVWPQSNVLAGGTVVANPYGECTGQEDAACAYVYGWTRAQEDATIRGVQNPSSLKWWLDVETTNSWSDTDFVANAASLEGMTAYFQSIGAQVGVYSTGYQWNTIVGNLDPTSNLNGLDSWLAGALTQRGTEANCADPALTPTSKVVLTQFTSKGLDYNVSCI